MWLPELPGPPLLVLTDGLAHEVLRLAARPRFWCLYQRLPSKRRSREPYLSVCSVPSWDVRSHVSRPLARLVRCAGLVRASELVRDTLVFGPSQRSWDAGGQASSFLSRGKLRVSTHFSALNRDRIKGVWQPMPPPVLHGAAVLC